MLKVALVGRPNVGKSSLFNRLTGKYHAIVHDKPGVTRDRRYGDASLFGLHFSVIDTAGLDTLGSKNKDALQCSMEQQTLAAVQECDVIFFIVDAREGLTPMDEHFAQAIRPFQKPTVLLANKAESTLMQQDLSFFKLGLGDPKHISAAHGQGMEDIYDALKPLVLEKKALGDNTVDIPKKHIQLSIIGQPNVGKSTLINALLKENRLLTGDMPGLTRDSIAVEWIYRDHPIKLVDTAGQRRRAKIKDAVERLSLKDAQRAVQYSHVVAVVLDASDSLEKQDLTLARHVIDEGRGLVIVLNKWDVVKDKKAVLEEIQHHLNHQFATLRDIPILTLSALKSTGLEKFMNQVLKTYMLWNTSISTGQLNQWMKYAVETHLPPLVNGRHIKFKYITQIKTRPPTMAVFTNLPKEIPESYKRYLINSLRESFDLPAIPLRFVFKASENPYHAKK